MTEKQGETSADTGAQPAGAEGVLMALSQRRYIRVRACRYGLMVYNCHDRYLSRSLEVYGEFSEGEVALFRTLVKPGNVVIEAGANIGAHTLFFAGSVGPQGKIFAFEPQRLLFQMLCANLALNEIGNVVARQLAVGSAQGSIIVPLLDPAKPQSFGSLSLGQWQNGEPVGVTTIDGLELGQCNLIKVDVEGMEAEVLLGARETIARCRPFLCVENDRAEKSSALIALIQEMGYRLWWHMPPLFNPTNFAGNPDNVFGRIVSLNLLCVPKEIPCDVGLREVSGPGDRPPSSRSR